MDRCYKVDRCCCNDLRTGAKIYVWISIVLYGLGILGALSIFTSDRARVAFLNAFCFAEEAYFVIVLASKYYCFFYFFFSILFKIQLKDN